MSSDNKDDNSEGEDLVSNNHNINPTTNPTDRNLPWMLILALADDDGDNDSSDYDEFCSDYDLDGDGVFDNDNADNGKGYLCMRVTDS